MTGKATAITRNWGTTIGYLIGGLVALGVSGWLFATVVSGAITAGLALVVAIIAIALLYGAKGAAAEAACPACSGKLTGLSTGSNDGVLCAQCVTYCEGKDGKLWSTDPARIADQALFGADLPAQFSWPRVCCVCGVHATHGEAISTEIQRAGSAVGVLALSGVTGGAVSGKPGATRFTVEVPHCDAHKDGARLSSKGGERLHVRFRSYPYLRSFCQQNNIRPT